MVGMTEDLSEDDSPPFALRKTTARTAAKAAHPAASPEPAAYAEGTEGFYSDAVHAEHATAAAACPAAAAAAPAGTPLRELPAGASLAAQHAAAAASARKVPAPPALAQDPMDVCWEPSFPMQPAPQLQPPAAAAAAAAPAAEAAGAGGRPSLLPAAAAEGAPAVQPKRPRGRPRLHVRPLELPLAPEDPAPMSQVSILDRQMHASLACLPRMPPQLASRACLGCRRPTELHLTAGCLSPHMQAAPAEGQEEEEEEESPALTHTAGPSLHLLSPSRTLSHAPPLFTPPSSVRKRALPPSRMAAFGPRPPPLSMLEDAAAGEVAVWARLEGVCEVWGLLIDMHREIDR